MLLGGGLVGTKYINKEVGIGSSVSQPVSELAS